MVVNLFVIATAPTNPLPYEILTIIEFLLFSGFIYLNLRGKAPKKSLIVASLLFVVFYFLYAVFLRPVEYIDSVPIGIETILILAFTFYFLYEEMNDTTTLFIYSKPEFWIALGIALYLAGSFFIYIFTNFLTPKEVIQYWFVTNLSSIIKNIFFTVAMFIQAKPTHNKSNLDLELSS